MIARATDNTNTNNSDNNSNDNHNNNKKKRRVMIIVMMMNNDNDNKCKTEVIALFSSVELYKTKIGIFAFISSIRTIYSVAVY